MWICPRCQNENKETFTSCETCGAPRSGGRFASAPARMDQTGRVARMSPPPAQPKPSAPAPRVTAVSDHYRAIRMPSNDIPDPLPEPKPQPAPFPGPMPPPRRAVMGFARLIGVLLCILLPLLAGFLAWRQYDIIQSALVPLFLDEGAAQWAQIALYSGLCLIAVLLSLLPGLWTLMKIPPRYKKPKKDEEE